VSREQEGYNSNQIVLCTAQHGMATSDMATDVKRHQGCTAVPVVLTRVLQSPVGCPQCGRTSPRSDPVSGAHSSQQARTCSSSSSSSRLV
jgi:hypothetical protein